MKGFFNFKFRGEPAIRIPNTVLDQGEEDFLKILFQGNNSIVAAGGNFYIGLCGAAFSEDTTLSTLSGEPTVGYARVAVTRDGTGWPTIEQVSGAFRALSDEVTFTATGNWDTPIYRAFLCNAASGTSGRLFAVSGALVIPRQLLDTETFDISYEFYLR